MNQKTYEKTPAVTVAYLGLGVMGAPMAGHLHGAGHSVTVFNRTEAKAKAWVSKHAGSHSASTPREAVAGADIVFACVGNDTDLRSIVLGENGAFAGMKPGAIFVDHTTASAEIARELGQIAADQGFSFIDAPVSGGEAGAVNGVLTVMCGGNQSDFDKVAPVAAAFARAFTLIGAAGSGQLAKMVNQICIAGILQGLSEAVNFGQSAELDMKLVLDVISKGAAQSWQMENRGHTMVDDKFDFGFAVEWMRKDLGLCIDEANRNGAPLPVTVLVDQFYKEVQVSGGARWDTSSLLRRLKRS